MDDMFQTSLSPQPHNAISRYTFSPHRGLALRPYWRPHASQSRLRGKYRGHSNTRRTAMTLHRVFLAASLVLTCFVATLAATLGAIDGAQAETYPSRTIKLIVPYT